MPSSDYNRVTSTEVDLLVDALQAAGIDKVLASRGQISKIAGVSDRRARTLQAYLRPVVLNQTDESSPLSVKLAEPPPAETHEVKSDSWYISIPKTRIKSLDELLVHCKVDLDVWEVDHHVINKWEMGSSVKDPTELFQIKAWLKRRSAVIAVRAEIAALKQEMLQPAFQFSQPVISPKPTGYMLEICIPDLHIGKLCASDETWGPDYNVRLAVQAYETALMALIERTSSYSFDKILLVSGNDFLHFDSKKGTTTAGTQMDTDGRYHSNFVTARQMTTAAIHRLKQLAPVDVVIVAGNHDELAMWHLGDSLQCLFANDPNVTVDNRVSLRKYYQFHKVMLMFAHGNLGSLKEYPLTMATEQPKMFGETVHREAHTGDKHQLRVQESHGVRTRIFSALTPSDKWHSDNFYVGMKRSAEAFVWHKDDGLVGTANYTVPE